MNQKQKNVQIPEELFGRLCMYHLLDRTEPENEELIKAGLEQKLQAMNRRSEYMSHFCLQKKQSRDGSVIVEQGG